MLLKNRKITNIFKILIINLFFIAEYAHSEILCDINIPKNISQKWLGPELWANTMSDWQINNGRIECVNGEKNLRNIHILTSSITKDMSSLTMSVTLGNMSNKSLSDSDWGGFFVGIGDYSKNYKERVLTLSKGKKTSGIVSGINGRGELFFYDINNINKTLIVERKGEFLTFDDNKEISLKLHIEKEYSWLLKGSYSLVLKAINISGETIQEIKLKDNVIPEILFGNMGIICNKGYGSDNKSFWFNKLKITGDGVKKDNYKKLSSIMGAMYLINDRTLRITVQLQPVKIENIERLRLKIFENNSERKIVWDSSRTIPIINPLGCYTTFEIKDWDASKQYDYDVTCDLKNNLLTTQSILRGVIQKEPTKEENVTLLALSNKLNSYKNIDFDIKNTNILCISKTLNDLEKDAFKETLYTNFLYQQNLFYWTYNKILMKTPVICILDNNKLYQDYKTNPNAQLCKQINVIEGAFYNHLTINTPKNNRLRSHNYTIKYSNIDFSTLKTSHIKQGDEQLLSNWAHNWNSKIVFKVALVQNLFNKMHEIANNERSNISTKIKDNRNNTLKLFRENFIFSIALNEDIGALIHNGIDEWKDCGVSFAIPQIDSDTLFQWAPSYKISNDGKVPAIGATGNFLDVNKDRFSLLHISKSISLINKNIYNGGYGIVLFNKKHSSIEVLCFSLQAKQHLLWSRKIQFSDNYKRKIKGYLPELIFRGIKNPIITIINEANNKIVYTRHIREKPFRPYVFENGKYTIKIGNENKKYQIQENLVPSKIKDYKKLYFSF